MFMFCSTLALLLLHGSEALTCDDTAKAKCAKDNKKSCTGVSDACGQCLEGFKQISSICVDVSQCQDTNIPSKMVLLVDSSGSIGATTYTNLKNFARDLVNVFPVDEFAIRPFSSSVRNFPTSGAFIPKAQAVSIIPQMPYYTGTTYTGKALEEAIKLLKDEKDSFNMVMLFTDGHATDGICAGTTTCNPTTMLCSTSSTSSKSCRTEIMAPRLKALSDLNQTVTVVSVGFGNVDKNELQFIASGQGDSNVVIATGSNAAAGLLALQSILGQLVDTVCNALPVDCLITYTEWTPCNCGTEFQTKKIDHVIESRNGGKPCPSSKEMRKTFKLECPVRPECTTTSTTVTDGVNKKNPRVTDAKGNPVTDANGSPVTATAGATTRGGKGNSVTATTVTDANGNPVTATAGATTTVTDANGNPVTPAAGVTTTMTDANGNRITPLPSDTTTPNEVKVVDTPNQANEPVINMVMWSLVTACCITMLIV